MDVQYITYNKNPRTWMRSIEPTPYPKTNMGIFIARDVSAGVKIVP